MSSIGSPSSSTGIASREEDREWFKCDSKHLDGASCPQPNGKIHSSYSLKGQASPNRTSMAFGPQRSGTDRAHSEHGKIKKKTRMEKNSDTNHAFKREKSASSFTHLVWGLETYVNEGAGNVQVRHRRDAFQPLQMLQNLSLCGASESFHPPSERKYTIEPPHDDPFQSIVLRHSHSSPIQCCAAFDDNPSPSTGVDQMRRSISTPSSTSFKNHIGFSSNGRQLEQLSHRSGQDVRSAFSLPIQQKSFQTASSDSGVRYSAFDPVPLTATVLETSEATSIEVMDLATQKYQSPSETVADEKVKILKAVPSRTARFLADVRVLRAKRSRRGGRENPATPLSPLLSSRRDSIRRRSNSKDPTLAYKHEGYRGSGNGEESCWRLSETAATSTNDGYFDDAGTPDTCVPDAAVGHYHQLDSDVDEEFEHYQRIEASVHTESPLSVPSPAYHQFLDEQIDTQAAGGDTSVPTVRIQVSSRTKPPGSVEEDNRDGSEYVEPSHPGIVLRRERDRNSLTPTSHDSGTQSAGTIRSTITNYTSGHTTQATSTSATVSSGQVTVLSSVNEEADREVMETNQAGKLRRRRHRAMEEPREQNESDGSRSFHSSSTASTRSHGYLLLAGSPVPLREGACLPVDHFFRQSATPCSSRRISTPAKSPVAGMTSIVDDHVGTGELCLGSANRLSTALQYKKYGGPESPATVSSASAGNTTSSVSTGEDPPKFVSYLHCKPASEPPSPEAGYKVSSSLPYKTDHSKGKDSPTILSGYSEVLSEEPRVAAHSMHPQPGRPQRRCIMDKGIAPTVASRPPRSPIKLGSKTPTSPPPAGVRPESITPGGFSQLSPPRNIIDPLNQRSLNRRAGTGLSRPHVFRTNTSIRSRRLVTSTQEARSTPACEVSQQQEPLTFPLSHSLIHAVGSHAGRCNQEVESASSAVAGSALEISSPGCFYSTTLLLDANDSEDNPTCDHAGATLDFAAAAEPSCDTGNS